MKKFKAAIIKILKSPPRKRVDCPRCGGHGIINLRGMYSSDDCPECKQFSGVSYHGTGKIWVQDFSATADKIIELAEALNKEM